MSEVTQMGTWSVYHTYCSRPHRAFLPLLHTAAAAARPFSMAKVPRFMGLPSFFSLSFPPSFLPYTCVEMNGSCFTAFDLRHILCVCLICITQLSNTSLPFLLIDYESILTAVISTCSDIFQWSKGVKPAKDT